MLGRLALATLVVAASLAGCLNAPLTQSGTGAPVDAPAPALVALDAAHDVLPSLPGEYGEGFDVAQVLLGHRGAEPNVGVTSTGTVFVTAGPNTMRSRDHGATWEVVFNLTEALPQDPAQIRGFTRSSDPMLWVDPLTDRVFTDHMTGLYCSNMIHSDDEGDSWFMKPMTCGLPVNDHQKVATAKGYGPGAPAPPAPAYPNPVYYCYNKLVSTQCAVSLDGGLNFAYDRTVATFVTGDCAGINGHPAPGPDGTMFVPITLGCPGPTVGVSEDNGLTWTIRKGPTEFGSEEIDAEITVTPDGTAYMLWRGSDQMQYLARSGDKFATWEGPWNVTHPTLKSTVFAGLTSGDDGRIAFAYLGTRDSTGDPSEAANETRWHLYTGYSLDAAAESPTFVVQQTTPDEDPVQIGCVWLRGGSGGPTQCRNLLDFIDMAADPEGRFYVAFTDGCTRGCAGVATATHEESRQRDTAVAVLVDGPALVGTGRITSA